MTELRNCSTCVFWRAGAAALTASAVHGVRGEVGACEFYPPEIIMLDGQPTSVQPTTHGTRCCNEWRQTDWFEYPPDDGPGSDPDPDPSSDPHDSGKIRRLFPNPPLRPIVA